MDNRSFLQEKAKHCRLMSALTTNPEIERQLRLWAYDFEDLAESAEVEDQAALDYRGETAT